MEGTILYEPDEDRIFLDNLLKHLKCKVKVIEVDCNLEDPGFAKVLTEVFDEIFRESRCEERICQLTSWDQLPVEDATNQKALRGMMEDLRWAK